MWNMRRRIRVDKLPRRRTVIQFIFPDQPERDRNYWFLVDHAGEPDLCVIDPGFEVDLYVRTDLRTMTAVFMGLDHFSKAVDDGRMVLIGDRGVEKNMLAWLQLSMFAGVEKQVA